MGSTTKDPGTPKQGSVHDARAALGRWTLERLEREPAEWLHRAVAMIEDRESTELAFGLAPRRVGKTPLAGDAAARDALAAEAAGLLPGWRPDLLRVDEAARILIAARRSDRDPQTLTRLIRHADAAEEAALFKGLPLMRPLLETDDLLGRGLRSNVLPVFEAIAHHNPWPAAHFDEHRWNHMILKALFLGVPLASVYGFEVRLNPTLERMVLDYAAERRAAMRTIPDDLWRCTSDEAAARFHDEGRAA